MSLLDKLSEELKTAMKSGDKLRVETLRLLRAQLKDAQIAKQNPLAPEDEMAVLNSAAKKRREAIEAYRKGGRDDLAEKESAELALIAEYLPKALSAEELNGLVEEAVQETGAHGLSDLGKVMSALMPKIKGRADGKMAQQIVRERLT